MLFIYIYTESKWTYDVHLLTLILRISEYTAVYLRLLWSTLFSVGFGSATPSPVVDAPVGSVTPVNRSLCICRLAWWIRRSCFIQEGGSRRLSAVQFSRDVWALYCWTTRYHGVQAVCCNSDSVQGVSLVLFGTGQKVRTVCLPARSTLILLSTSAEGGMKVLYYVINIMSSIISSHWLRVFHLVLYVWVSLAT